MGFYKAAFWLLVGALASMEVYFGVARLGTPCPVAPTLSILDIALGAAILVVVISELTVDLVKSATGNAGGLAQHMASYFGLFAVLGLLTWGAVLCFRDNLWNRMLNATPAQAAQMCDSSMYFGNAIAVMAGGAGFVLAFAVFGIMYAVRNGHCCCKAPQDTRAAGSGSEAGAGSGRKSAEGKPLMRHGRAADEEDPEKNA